MDHNFVFNTLSLPASDANVAYRLLLDTAKGMLAVGSGNDRYAIFSDNLRSCEVAPNFTYSDFLSQLAEQNEIDLQLALLEIDDKTPMFDFISAGIFDEIASSAFYFPDEPYTTSIDILAVAWHLDATLFSIATAEKWRTTEIEFAEFVDGVPSTGTSHLRNISCEEHGNVLRHQYESESSLALNEMFPNCQFSDDFLGWHNTLPTDLYSRVNNKFALAEAKKFQGGKPLFETLTDADGLREMRFSAVQGGAVRILFGALPEKRQAILVGFIKKSNTEGYVEAISSAKKIWAEMKAN